MIKLIPYVAVALLIAGLSAASYGYGYSKAGKHYEAALNDVLEQARRREQEWVDYSVERNKAATERLRRFKVRTDEASIEWAAVNVPDGERDRMLVAVSGISASSGRTTD